jgi:4-amino-4-deoxy-L-arabinose transferase-like glycosyltransferase
VTGFLDGFLAVVIATILNVVVVVQIGSRTAPDEARFVSKVYGWTLLLRYGLAILLNIFAVNSAFSATFWGDSDTYDIGGTQLALRWSGEPVASAYMLTSVSGYGWVYFVGAIYYLVGRNQLLVQFLNGMLGALTVLVIYAIAARLFGRAAARWAALFMAFFPQMVFWSAGMYKDPAVLLCIAVCMYAVLRLRERLSVSMIVLFVMSELALITLRFYIAYFVAFAALATFFFTQRRGAVRSALNYGLLAALLFGALTLAVRRETLEQQASYMNLERLQVTRQDQAMWGSSGFGQEHNVSTTSGALMALPLGLVYLLFAPFPWAVSGLRQALALPETLVWYALMPAFVRGFAYAVRHRLREILPILVFATTLTAAYAIMQGNVGTAYRQRTQVSMFFFVFMGVGLTQRRRERQALGSAWPQPSRGAQGEG